ncbi:MAG: serine hydrolase, partial [Bacteroidota bacterium]
VNFSEPSKNLAKGYLYHNYQDSGLERQVSPTFNREEAFSSRGFQTSIQDVYALSKELENRQLAGYLSDDGFSYGLSREGELTIIILSNYRHPVATEMITSIQAILNDQVYQLPLVREPVQVSTDVMRSYVGEYVINENFTANVIVENARLYVMMGRKVPLIPQAENQFYLQESDAAMRFLKNEQGEVYAVELLDGFVSGKVCMKK